MHPARLLIDPAAGGAWNMAVDEALLDHAACGGPWTLRFYGWSTPTLSLGYFQPHRRRRQHAASRALPLVRRPSGGGAIVHDRELTYSIAAPLGTSTGQSAAAQSRWLYRAVHAAWADVLARLRIEAQLCESECDAAAPDEEPFLCFQRRARGDLVAGGLKLAGSAQRRRRGALLQHGSVLLGTSPAAPELAGLERLCGADLSASDWIELALEPLSKRLNIELARGQMSAAESARAAVLAREKYGQTAWNERR